MPYVFVYAAAVVLTALAYLAGDLTLHRRLAWYEAGLIGFAVVTLGALAERLGAPLWLIIATPFPVGMGLLYLLMGAGVREWAVTYALTLVYYVVVHVLASRFVGIHSLIPAWKLG